MTVGNRPILWATRTLVVEGPSEIRASFRDLSAKRRRSRAIGIPTTVVGGAALVVAVPVAIMQAAGDCFDGCGDAPVSAGQVMAIGGGSLLVLGISALAILATSHDAAEFEPLTIRF